jgi:PBP4 family serine-type D-alanyl-D-alanine carboxypeptidase
VRARVAFSFSFRFCLLVVLALAMTLPSSAQSSASLSVAERIQKVMNRPEFAHANFGIEFYSPDTRKAVFSLNDQELFVPASTTKLLTEGTVLASLGADFRFYTRIYRTGAVDSKGRLKGDLVLVASGDPNLSNRIQSDGTLAFANNDHSYSGNALPGDPLIVIRQLAKDVAAKGIRKIEGRVLVDSSLFPETPWEGEGGGGVVISPIVVNDNLIDLVMTPAAKIGDPVVLDSSPATSYVKFINHLTTAGANTSVSLDPPQIKTNADGTVIATLTGSLPLGAPRKYAPFFVPSPTVLAETVLREALEEVGIKVKVATIMPAPDFQSYRRFYAAEAEVAEHISLPLAEEIKVTLKVSQNLHAFMGPYLLGALVAKNAKDPFNAGFAVEKKFLEDAKLDLSGASQGDGAGGSWADLFTPDFMCHYLAYWTTRPDYPTFLRGLPILGWDGTLADIDRTSPAVGHVFAKTGTFDSEDTLNDIVMLNGKGLAGYVIRADGKRLTFAAYVNHVHMRLSPEAAAHALAEALGQIAAAAYDAPLDEIAPEERHETREQR